MGSNEFDLEDFVSRICGAASQQEALLTYLSGLWAVRDLKLVVTSPDGTAPSFAANRDFASGAAVRSLFKNEKVLFLDPQTVREALVEGKNQIPLDYSISLDTQALSHLKPYVTGRTPEKVDKDLREVFEFIARDDVYVDPTPYMLENLNNLLDGENAANEVFSRLRAYEILRTLDKQWFHTTGEARSNITDDELDARAQTAISRMYYSLADPSFVEGHRFQHAFEYAHLLKMSSIALGRPHMSIDEKMWLFTKFCDETLATFSGRETVLARAFFERGQKLKFFGRVQKKHKDLLKVLKNMAWDLSHARRMELGITLRPDARARYFLPSLLTFDKDFIEILELYPLRACAFEEETFQPMPFFDGNWKQSVATTSEKSEAYFTHFFSPAARDSRDVRRKNVRKGFGAIVASLEKEVTEAAEI